MNSFSLPTWYWINRITETPEQLVHKVMELYDVEMSEAYHLLNRYYYIILKEIEEKENEWRIEM